MSERDHDVHELDRLWNALLADHLDVDDSALNPADLDDLQAFHALVPPPAPASLTRVDAAVRAAIDEQISQIANRDAWQILTVPMLPTSANGSGKPVALTRAPSAPRGRRQSLSLAALRTAALILLMLVAGLVGAGRWSRSHPSNGDLGVIPAIEDTSPSGQAAATPRASEAISATSLLDITLPAAMLGRQSGAVTPNVTWSYVQYGIDPGKQVTYSKACAAPDFVVRYVLQGTYAARAAGPLEVMRLAADGGPGESVPPKQEVMLHAGDALLYHNTMGDDFAGFRNAGSDEVELLDWQWLEDDCLDAIPAGMKLRWDAFPGDDVTSMPLPIDTSRPLRIHLRELDVPPGVAVPQAGPDGPGLLPPGFPGIEVAVADQGRVSTTDSAPQADIHLVSSHTPPAGGVVSGATYLPAGSVRTVQSTGSEPLRLYTLTIVNTEASAPSTPAAAG